MAAAPTAAVPARGDQDFALAAIPKANGHSLSVVLVNSRLATAS